MALLLLAVLAGFVLPGAAAAQGLDTAHINGRLNDLQRSVAALSAQLEQIKAQDQQLQRRLEMMQTSIGQRIERLERAPAPKPVPRRSGKERH